MERDRDRESLTKQQGMETCSCRRASGDQNDAVEVQLPGLGFSIFGGNAREEKVKSFAVLVQFS